MSTPEEFYTADNDFKNEVLSIVANSEWLIDAWNNATELQRQEFLDELALAAANCY